MQIFSHTGDFPTKQTPRAGFTIVELLIVVVVVAILATITVVAYSGISSQARESSLKSDLRDSAVQLNIIKVETGSFPGNIEIANLKSSGDNLLYYSGQGDTFCVSASSPSLPGKSFRITQQSAIEEGTCVPAVPDTQTAKLLSNDSVDGGLFVTDVDIDGDTAVIGVSGEGLNRGATYIFRYSSNNWILQARITADDGLAGDRFGDSVSLDGDRLLVSASGTAAGGSAYVFERLGLDWVQQAKLTGSGVRSGDLFGVSVALDGDTALVGKRYGSAAAHVFVRQGGGWIQQAVLTADDVTSTSYFGKSVSLEGDLALVGAVSSGAVYVFSRDGVSWSQQSKLVAEGEVSPGGFGNSTDLSSGNVIVGAYNAAVGGLTQAGAAYIFVRKQDTWIQEVKLTANDGRTQDNFGTSVAFSRDTVVVGAPRVDTPGSDAGAAYVFTRTSGSWTQRVKLRAGDPVAGVQFGSAVALSGDRAISGVRATTGEFGAAYVFQDLD